MRWPGKDKAPDLQPVPHYYILEVDRGETEKITSDLPVLNLLPLKITSRYRDVKLVFRLGNESYQSEPNHQFITSPEDILTQQVKNWLEKSGLFSKVMVGGKGGSGFTLETAVTAFYGVARPNLSPAAVLEMQFFLTDLSKSSEGALFEYGLRVSAEVTKSTPAETVIGWRQALMKTLIGLELNLSDYFQK